jgi:hypothetical protein
LTFTLYVNNPVYWHVNVLVGGGPKHDANLDSFLSAHKYTSLINKRAFIAALPCS